MKPSKKVAGIAVLKDSDGNMTGRIISDDEKQMLLSQFGTRFQVPVLIGENYTIGDVRSDTGIGFKALPELVIFGVILTTSDCEFTVYAEAEPAEALEVVTALGGASTFDKAVNHFGNTYSAHYTGGSVSWDPVCL